MLKVGDKAPDFELVDQNNAKVKLSDNLGSWVVLYFYPKALTPGCTVQACAIRDSISDFETKNIKVFGVSGDKPEKLKKFETKKQLNFQLLSDEQRVCLNDYGVWQLKKFMGREYMGIMRWTFIIDKQGNIAEIIEKVNTKSHHRDVLAIIEQLEE